jgi:hypothetical protein
MDPLQQVQRVRAVRCLDQRLQNVSRVVCQTLAEDEALAVREAVDSLQELPRRVIPLDRHHRRLAMASVPAQAKGVRSPCVRSASFGCKLTALARVNATPAKAPAPFRDRAGCYVRLVRDVLVGAKAAGAADGGTAIHRAAAYQNKRLRLRRCETDRVRC